MRLVRLHMRGSITRNFNFGLKWMHCGPKGDILDYFGQLIFWFVILLYLIEG